MDTTQSVLSQADLDRLIHAIQLRVQQVQEEQIMHRKEAAKFLGIGTRQLDKLTNASKLPYHRIEGLAAKLYLRTELLEHVKRS
jgi:hypothetical protein